MLNDDVLFLIKNDYEKHYFCEDKKNEIDERFNFNTNFNTRLIQFPIMDRIKDKQYKYMKYGRNEFYKNGKPKDKKIYSTIIKEVIDFLIQDHILYDIDELKNGNLKSNKSELYKKYMKFFRDNTKKIKDEMDSYFIYKIDDLKPKCNCCGERNNKEEMEDIYPLLMDYNFSENSIPNSYCEECCENIFNENEINLFGDKREYYFPIKELIKFKEGLYYTHPQTYRTLVRRNINLLKIKCNKMSKFSILEFYNSQRHYLLPILPICNSDNKNTIIYKIQNL